MLRLLRRSELLSFVSSAAVKRAAVTDASRWWGRSVKHTVLLLCCHGVGQHWCAAFLCSRAVRVIVGLVVTRLWFLAC